MKKYSHLFFDCDGVILNSNKIKTDAFYKIGLQYGESEAKKLVDYHINNGGVSRYKKINFFQKSIIKNEDKRIYRKLVLDYGNNVKQDLLKTEISKGIFEFIDAAKIIKSKNLKVKFQLAGKPDLYNPLSISYKVESPIAPRARSSISAFSMPTSLSETLFPFSSKS